MLKKPSGVWIVAYTTIDNPELYFQTVLWSGDSNSPRTITFDGSEDMQPDWIWSKKRNSADYGQIYDSVRTFGAGKEIVPSDNFEEGNSTNNSTALGYISSVTSDGFVLTEGNHGTSSIRSLLLNHSGSTHVAWGWKAGGSASSNSDGDVTASVSANTTAGFSIVKFTSSSSSGAMTVGHGLGATPQVVIVKDIGATGNWQVYFEGIGTANQQYLKLNDTDAVANYSGLWGAGMTSSLIGIGVGVAVDASESDIAYCFAEKQGYSKFGRYDGNGNADGPFIYTGFKPAWLMVKGYAGTDDWIMMDNKRSGFNSENEYLDANNNSVESDGSGNIDFLSNGFKIKRADVLNVSTEEYIYWAFAEAPFVNSSGIPCNAR